MPALFNFVSLGLTLKYLGLCFFSVLGALQIVAGRRDIEGLSLLPVSLRRWQALLGAGLIVVAFAVFFAITPEVFIPGLAGAELITLFGIGALAALLFTLGVAQVRWKPSWVCVQPRETLELPGCDGVLLPPASGGEKALCLVPDPAEPCLLDPLGERLAAVGFSVLILRWKEPLDFEGALGVLALAMRELAQKRGLRWVGVVGHRLGGDIALRFTGEDEEVKAVIAIAPFLDPANAEPGMEWLEEAPILTSHRRLQGKGEMLRELAPVKHLGELEDRPCLIIADSIGVIPALGKRPNLRIVRVEGHPWRLALSKPVVDLVLEWVRQNYG